MAEAMISDLERLLWTARTAWWALPEKSFAWWSPEAVESAQARRLRALLRHAAARIAFYRDWLRSAGAEPDDVRSVNDLRRLPLIGKQDYDAQPERFTDPSCSDGLTLESSGTAGRSRTIRYDAAALFRALAAGGRQRLVLRHFVGKEFGYREAVVHREGSVSRQLRRWWEARLGLPAGIELRRLWLSPLLPYPKLLDELNAFRPEVIRGYGSHLGAFCRWVAAEGRRLERPRAVIYGADTMSPADRRLIETELGVPVLSTYQAVEALRLGFECEQRAGFHLSLDQVDVRIVDAQGRDLPAGVPGEVVISNLTNRATVVLNYRLGDVARFVPGRCACGRSLPRLAGLEGRTSDLIRRRDGSRWAASAVLAPLQAVPGVHRLQLVQEGFDDFRLRVAWGPRAEPLWSELRAKMEEIFGAGARISVESADSMEAEPSGKVKTIICRMGES